MRTWLFNYAHQIDTGICFTAFASFVVLAGDNILLSSLLLVMLSSGVAASILFNLHVYRLGVRIFLAHRAELLRSGDKVVFTADSEDVIRKPGTLVGGTAPGLVLVSTGTAEHIVPISAIQRIVGQPGR